MRRGLAAAGVVAAGLICAAVVQRVARDYEQRGRLSASTSAVVWALYVTHWSALASAARRRAWRLPIPDAAARAVGAGAVNTGVVLFGAGVAAFRSLRQMSGMSNEGLVTTGVYRYSRNPQNVGGLLVLTGVALLGGSGLALSLAGIFFGVTRLYLVIEERHMRRVYGDRWDAYATRTPRFLGRPRR